MLGIRSGVRPVRRFFRCFCVAIRPWASVGACPGVGMSVPGCALLSMAWAGSGLLPDRFENCLMLVCPRAWAAAWLFTGDPTSVLWRLQPSRIYPSMIAIATVRTYAFRGAMNSCYTQPIAPQAISINMGSLAGIGLLPE